MLSARRAVPQCSRPLRGMGTGDRRVPSWVWRLESADGVPGVDRRGRRVGFVERRSEGSSPSLVGIEVLRGKSGTYVAAEGGKEGSGLVLGGWSGRGLHWAPNEYRRAQHPDCEREWKGDIRGCSCACGGVRRPRGRRVRCHKSWWEGRHSGGEGAVFGGAGERSGRGGDHLLAGLGGLSGRGRQ